MRLIRRPRLDAPLARLRDQLDQMFEQPDFGLGEMMNGWMPAVDVFEDNNTLTVMAELPGFKREDLEVSLHEDSLVLSGERRREANQKEGGTYRMERFYGRFHRTVPLPFPVDSEKIQARYRDGILTVLLPKSEKAKARQIEVAVG